MIYLSFQSEFDEFFVTFTSLLKKSLVYGDKQPAVDRTLAFVAKFATVRKDGKDEKNSEVGNEEEEIEEEADLFLVKLMEFLLNVRFSYNVL